MELLVEAFDGKISRMKQLKKGFTRIKIIQDDLLFGNLKSDVVWMNHFDAISQMPFGFRATAITENKIVAAITDDNRVWGIQFHPESKTEVLNGYLYFENFIEICRS